MCSFDIINYLQNQLLYTKVVPEICFCHLFHWSENAECGEFHLAYFPCLSIVCTISRGDNPEFSYERCVFNSKSLFESVISMQGYLKFSDFKKLLITLTRWKFSIYIKCLFETTTKLNLWKSVLMVNNHPWILSSPGHFICDYIGVFCLL